MDRRNRHTHLVAALLALLVTTAQADQSIFTATTYQAGSSLTITPTVPLLGTWDFSTATVLGISGGVTSLTATAPIIVTPNPITATGAVSLDPTTKSQWDTAYTDRMKWDGGATGLNAATARANLIPGGAALTPLVKSTTADGDYTWLNTGTGLATLTAGVLNVTPDIQLRWDGGATSLNAATGRTSLGLNNVTNDAQTQAAIVPNTAPASGQILVGNAGGTAYAPKTVSGSGATITMTSNGIVIISGIIDASLTNPQTYAAVVPNTVPADGEILIGATATSRYVKRALINMTLSASGVVSGITNGALANSSITIAGTSVALGGSIALGPEKVTWYTAQGAGTHTTATGCRAMYVEMVGGGGGGGGAVAAASQCAAGGGGGGGAWSAKYIASPAASYNFNVGAGSAGGGVGGGNGIAGGNSTWAISLVTAGGGAAGTGDAAASANPKFGGAPGQGGVVGAGDVSGSGGSGDSGMVLFVPSGAKGGQGGDSIWGAVANVVGGGANGKGIGGGGQGARSNSATGAAGGSGADGAIKVTEYF